MLYNSLTREAVCSLTELINFGAACCSWGFPSGRVAEEIARVSLFRGCVMVKMAVGTGGAKPPVIPKRVWLSECGYNGAVKSTSLKSQRILSDCHDGR